MSITDTNDTSTEYITEDGLLEDAAGDEDGEAEIVSSPGASHVSGPIRVIPATDASHWQYGVCCELRAQPQLTTLYCTHCTVQHKLYTLQKQIERKQS